MSDAWTIQRLLTWTSAFFSRREIDSPRLTAELLLAHALGIDRLRLYIEFDRPIDETERARFRDLVQRRAAREPTYYLTETRLFFGRSFRVDARVLIPRPETEHLVEAALAHLPEDSEGEILELCTGSGCIGLSLLAERPKTQLIATDLSSEALVVARQNARSIGVDSRVTFLKGDLFDSIAPHRFELVVSNPPYVPSAEIDMLAPEVLREPRMALDGGEDGLRHLNAIVERAPDFLKPGGALCLEIGEGQGTPLLEHMNAAGFEAIRIERDLAGLERMALGRMPG